MLSDIEVDRSINKTTSVAVFGNAIYTLERSAWQADIDSLVGVAFHVV
jgi:hypothetical protein